MTHLVNAKDRPPISRGLPGGVRQILGTSGVPAIETSNGVSRFLGSEGDAEEGPRVYYGERPKGDLIQLHKHPSNRIEFLVSGEIEWFEQGQAPRKYGAGSLSHVIAGVAHGYRILEHAAIPIIFDAKPGIHILSSAFSSSAEFEEQP